MLYAEKKREESPFVSVNGLIKPRSQFNEISPILPVPTGRKYTPTPSFPNNEVSQLKKVDSDEKFLEGTGGNVANSKSDPLSSSYSKFKQEVIRRKEEKDQKAELFWAMKGVEAPSPSESNIRYRDSLAQKAGASNTTIIQASLVVIGYNLGPYGPEKNGVDGHMGSLTEKAIKEFQRTAGLKPTGQIDSQTMAALDLVVKAGLNQKEIKEIQIDSGDYSRADQVVTTARQHIGVVNCYSLGAKYDFKNNEYYSYYNVPSKYVFSEPTLDCSGFTHKVIKEAMNYELPDGSENQRDKLGTQDKAVVGGLVFIGPPLGGSVNHIMIVTEVDQQGKPLKIIDSSSSQNGVSERAWPSSWDQRNPQYLKAPWLE